MSLLLVLVIWLAWMVLWLIIDLERLTKRVKRLEKGQS
jgi:hypothetical protein